MKRTYQSFLTRKPLNTKLPALHQPDFPIFRSCEHAILIRRPWQGSCLPVAVKEVIINLPDTMSLGCGCVHECYRVFGRCFCGKAGFYRLSEERIP